MEVLYWLVVGMPSTSRGVRLAAWAMCHERSGDNAGGCEANPLNEFGVVEELRAMLETEGWTVTETGRQEHP